MLPLVAFAGERLALVDEQGRVTVMSNEVPCFALPVSWGWGANRVRSHLGRPLAVAWRPLSSDLAVCFDKAIVLIRESDDEKEQEIACAPQAIAWHGKGRLLFFVDIAGSVKVLDAAAPQRPAESIARIPHATSLAWSDIAGLAIGAPRRVRVLDSTLGEEIWTPGGRVATSWTSDGKSLFYASDKGLFKIAWPAKVASALMSAAEMAQCRSACGGGGGSGDLEPFVASDGEGLLVALCFGAPSKAVAILSTIDKTIKVLAMEDAVPSCMAFSTRRVLCIKTNAGLRMFEKLA